MENKGFFTGFLMAACLAIAVALGVLIAEVRSDRDRANRVSTPCPCPDCKCRLPTAPGPAVPNKRIGDVGDTK